MSLLQIEWLKLRKYKTFWVLSALFAVILPLWITGVSRNMISVNSNGKGTDLGLFNNAYSFANVWANVGWWASIFIILTTVLVIIITTNEYSFRTGRQNLIDGLNRTQILNAKWILVVALAAATTVYVFLVGVFIAMSKDSMSNFPGNIVQLFHFFILAVNYYSFGLLIALFIKRSGLAIGLFFLYCMFVEKIVQTIINWSTHGSMGNLLPLQTSDELLPFPVFKTISSLTGESTQPNITTSTYVIASVLWIIIYYLISRYKLLKTDW